MNTPNDSTQVALEYVRAFNECDLDAMRELLAPDFVWLTAIVDEGETKPRPFQSELLRDHPSLFPPVRNRDETLAMLEPIFAGGDTNPFTSHVVEITTQDDRVAIEVEGNARNPRNGRVYRNLYCIVMRVRDWKLVSYKEYQDTMHVFDVFFAE